LSDESMMQLTHCQNSAAARHEARTNTKKKNLLFTQIAFGRTVEGLAATAVPGITGTNLVRCYESARSRKRRLSAPLNAAVAAKTTTPCETTAAIDGCGRDLH